MSGAGHSLTSVVACIHTALRTGRPVPEAAAGFLAKALRLAWERAARCQPALDLDAQLEQAPSLRISRSYVLDCLGDEASAKLPRQRDEHGRTTHTLMPCTELVSLVFDESAQAIVFEAVPEAFALVRVRGVVYGVVGVTSAPLTGPGAAVHFVSEHQGFGAPCNVFE
jgi:hypothetical protein